MSVSTCVFRRDTPRILPSGSSTSIARRSTLRPGLCPRIAQPDRNLDASVHLSGGIRGCSSEEEDDDPGLVIMYADHATIHRALGLAGAPVPQGGTEAASGEAFRQYVFSQLVLGVPDRVLHCVEDAQRTFGPTTEYFPNLFQKLPGRAYANLILRVKQLFPPQSAWVQALPGPLGTLIEVRGATVVLQPATRPFKYP